MKLSSPRSIIFITIFIDLLGFGIIIPIIGVINEYFEHPQAAQAPMVVSAPQQPGAPAAAVSADAVPPEKVKTRHDLGRRAAILMTAFSLLQMLFSPFFGRLSDRFGRRPVLLFSLFGSTVSYLMLAFSSSFGWLLASRILAGLCGANITAAQAFMADITSEKDRTAGMGLIGIAFGLGFTFGPVIGGGAMHLWEIVAPTMMPHTGPGLAAAAICGLNFLWACFKLPESLPREKRGQVHFRRFATTREAMAVMRHPAVGPLITLFFLVTFAFSKMEVSFSLYSSETLGLGLRGIYGYFVFIGLAMAFVQGYLIRRLVLYVPETILMIAGAAILALGLYLLPAWPSRSYMLLPLAILALGQGICLPSILSLISRCAGVQNQGNTLGASQAASSLARIVGPVVGGPLFDIRPSLPFHAAALIMALAACWAITTRRRLIHHEGSPITEESCHEIKEC